MNAIATLVKERDSLLLQLANHEKSRLKPLIVIRDGLKVSVDAAASTHQRLTGERDALIAKITARSPRIAEMDQEIVQLRNDATTPEKMAARVLAGQSRAPLALQADTDTAATGKKKATLLEQYNSLTTEKERTAFFAKHGDKL